MEYFLNGLNHREATPAFPALRDTCPSCVARGFHGETSFVCVDVSGVQFHSKILTYYNVTKIVVTSVETIVFTSAHLEVLNPNFVSPWIPWPPVLNTIYLPPHTPRPNPPEVGFG